MGSKVVLIGGCGGGKSALALETARRAGADSLVFIATATPFDDEMRVKIEKHKEERGGDFTTVEEPLRLADALSPFADDPAVCAVVDCLTVWLCNLAAVPADEAQGMRNDFLLRFGGFKGSIIAVTNETGMGVIPADRQTRDYAAVLAETNRKAVALADEAYLVVAGRKVRIKPGGD